MRYRQVEIGSVVTLRQGFAINKNTKHHMSEEPTNLPLLRIADMKDGSQNVFVKDTIPPHFIAKLEDIIYTRTGQVGLVFTKQFGVIHNNCFTVTPNDEGVLSRKYLYYALNSEDFYTKANNLASGAAQPDLPHGAFNSISIYLPPIDTQKRIASILSAYDDLIENNQKQIKLLEEAAQRLYKEWFVDFRLPGYENTPIIDGLPQGWRNGTLGEIAFFKRGKTITKDQTCEGVVPVVAGGLEPAYYHNQSNTASPVITVSGSGANAGFTRMYHTPIWASDCSFVDSQNTGNIYFAYCVLKSKKEDIDVLQKGAAQPHVYAKDINALEILVPESNCLAEFERVVAPFFEKIKVLYKQIKLSKESRDRLLPKLMSGELEV